MIPTLPAIIASRYRPIRLIAQGGMGAVYEVEHTGTGERLALKVLLSGVNASPAAIERFKREARASARIKSEHVVRVTDADVAAELGGAPFLVMDLLDGMDLETAATAARPSPATVVDWLRQVAQAIDKAHRLGVIHRDLKPENLFLATVEPHRSIVKVLDFGIAKTLEEGTETGTGATGSGQILGTPKYMAPEQASTGAAITPATDRCALGLVAFRLLVGESYYQGGVMSILGQLLHGELTPPSLRGSSLGQAFDTWFLKACHREPAQRFASAAAQIEALAQTLGLPSVGGDAVGMTSATPSARPSSSSHPATRPTARRPIAGAAVLAAVAVAGMLLYRRPRPDEPRPSTVEDLPSAVPAPPQPPAQPQPPVPDTNVQPPPPETTQGNRDAAPAAVAERRPGKTRLPRHLPTAQPVARPIVGSTAPPVPDPYSDQK